jgi:hypothetical protein
VTAQNLSPTPPKGRWAVYRQDDNGNVFVVRRGLSQAEAQRLAAELESHGHKQLYWVTAEEMPGSP